MRSQEYCLRRRLILEINLGGNTLRGLSPFWYKIIFLQENAFCCPKTKTFSPHLIIPNFLITTTNIPLLPTPNYIVVTFSRYFHFILFIFDSNKLTKFHSLGDGEDDSIPKNLLHPYLGDYASFDGILHSILDLNFSMLFWIVDQLDLNKQYTPCHQSVHSKSYCD